MSPAPLCFDPPPGEPLAIFEPAGATQTQVRRLEYSCRGDRALLEVLAPQSQGPFPTLLLQPAPLARPVPAGGIDSLPGIGTWLEAGVAVASLTPPLFGRRRSRKLSDKLENAVAAATAGEPARGTDLTLWSEFTRQWVLELRRGLDALEQIWGGAPQPVMFAGAGLAASVGAIFCAVDDRPRAALLASARLVGPDPIHPRDYLGDIAPRPVHLLEEDAADLLDSAWKLLSPLKMAD